MAKTPEVIVQKVTGMRLRRPPMLRMSCSPRERVDDRTGGEEEQRLEEGVGEQMEDSGGVGSDSAGQEHVAELRDGGVGEHALDVVLHHADGGGDDRRRRTDDGDDDQRRRASGQTACGSARPCRCPP